jgi:hypothetical protein
MASFGPVSDPHAISNRVDHTRLNVERVDETHYPQQDAPRFRVRVSGVLEIEHAEDIFTVLWNDPDGVEVEWIDGDGGIAEVELYEMG